MGTGGGGGYFGSLGRFVCTALASNALRAWSSPSERIGEVGGSDYWWGVWFNAAWYPPWLGAYCCGCWCRGWFGPVRCEWGCLHSRCGLWCRGGDERPWCCLRHSGTWRFCSGVMVGRASKKTPSFCSTSAALLVMSIRTFTAGLLCQLMHTISPLSSNPTG